MDKASGYAGIIVGIAPNSLSEFDQTRSLHQPAKNQFPISSRSCTDHSETIWLA